MSQHDPKTCLRCAFIRAVEDKYPNWSCEDNPEADEDIMETLISFSGYMLAHMNQAGKDQFLLDLGLRTAHYERIAGKIKEQKSHLN